MNGKDPVRPGRRVRGDVVAPGAHVRHVLGLLELSAFALQSLHCHALMLGGLSRSQRDSPRFDERLRQAGQLRQTSRSSSVGSRGLSSRTQRGRSSRCRVRLTHTDRHPGIETDMRLAGHKPAFGKARIEARVRHRHRASLSNTAVHRAGPRSVQGASGPQRALNHCLSGSISVTDDMLVPSMRCASLARASNSRSGGVSRGRFPPEPSDATLLADRPSWIPLKPPRVSRTHSVLGSRYSSLDGY